jgi:hypothetical protein
MDSNQIAQRMLEWEVISQEIAVLTEKANAIRAEIEQGVLALGKTQVAGNVRAVYSAGRKAYLYADAISDAGISADDMKPYEKVSYDYRKACSDFGITPGYTEGEPTIALKITG